MARCLLRLARVQMVEDEYEDMFPGQVMSVETLHDTTTLEGLAAKYEKLNKQMWDLIGDYSNKQRDCKKVKRKQVGAPALLTFDRDRALDLGFELGCRGQDLRRGTLSGLPHQYAARGQEGQAQAGDRKILQGF